MKNYTLSNTKSSYLAAWNNMEIHPSTLPKAQAVADKIISFRDRYKPLEAATGVPWYFIGLLHMRESNFNFDTHLHNGDPLNVKGMAKRTTHVPANRPIAPPQNGKTYTFEESAVDALTYEFGKVKDWSVEQIAYFQEKYNGFGYRNMGLPSPYLWAGSNQYARGKYIRDGVFDPTVVDSQLGVMVVLKCILDRPELVVAKVEQETIAAKEEIVSTPPPLSPAADTSRPTNKEMRKVSKKFSVVEWFEKIVQLITGFTIGGTAINAANISATKVFMDTVKSLVTDYGIFVAILGLLAACAVLLWLKERMKTDVEQDRSTPSGA